MRLVADSKIPFAREAFDQFGEVVTLDTREITPVSVRTADVVLVRSETKVDRALLDGSNVKFVGTATIGTDHVDIDYLAGRGIGFSSAPGSNANSVAEYIVAALSELSARYDFRLKGMVLGVVGVGNIGSRVVRYAQALGMNVLQNDPPRARQTGLPQFLPLDDLMGCDVLTLHVPLSRTGPDATFHFFNRDRIRKLKQGSILINTSRGPVVETDALKNALSLRHLRACVLDVWEHEPCIDAELLRMSELGTPHISGYSFDGKVNGTRMLYEALCRHLGQPAVWDQRVSFGTEVNPSASVAVDASSPEVILRKAVQQCYDIERDDRSLRGVLNVPEDGRGSYFQNLRARYPRRREFFNSKVMLTPKQRVEGEVLSALGFQVEYQFGVAKSG